MSVPNTLQDIINKVRRITARPSDSQITDDQIVDYVNTFYIYDMPEHLRLQNLRVNYQFLTEANVPIYDFPKELYLNVMPPIFIAGYQSYMTQSRENFYRINPELNLLQIQVATGNGSSGPYNFTLTGRPILRGFKRNPPGAYSAVMAIPASQLNWNVVISGTDSSGLSTTLIDDGQGNLFDVSDADLTAPRGNINYITGVVTCTFTDSVGSGNAINAQYVPYQASRPQQAVFYQDQIAVWPIPDQAYTVSFEAYMYPTAFANNPPDTTLSPQLNEWWQLLAYGAADKIFADNADMENMQKFRPLLDEQMRLVQRRTIVQQTCERVSTIYTEQTGAQGQWPFGNLFSF